MSVPRLLVGLLLVYVSSAVAMPLQQLSTSSDSVLYVQAVERSFQQGLDSFREKRFREAEQIFQRIVDLPKVTHRTSAAYLMAGKALYHEEEYSGSVALLNRFVARFGDSEYLDDAWYTLGLDLYQLERYPESAQLFLKVQEASPDSVLAARAGKMMGIVVADNLGLDEVRDLLKEATKPGTKGMLTVVLAGKVLRTGDTKEARALLNYPLSLPMSSPAYAEARALLDRIDRSGLVKIGVVLPMTFRSDPSAGRALGAELLDGMQLAVKEYNAEAMPKVNLEVRDSERDAGVATRQVSELSMDDQILAIVGPVFSNEVFSSAHIANERGVPMITPTATSDGIAALGEYVFQTNPDFIVRGRAMAQYAAIALGAKNLAVIGASDTINKTIAQAFIREARSLGCTVIDYETYAPGQTDLRDELMRIRQRGMELSEPVVVNFTGKMRPAELKKMAAWGIPQQVLDSLASANAMVTVETLFGPAGRRVADSLNLSTQRIKAKYDSLSYPVTAIDAIFAPIAGPDEIGIVTSQARYFNFQTQLLGTGNWYDLSELEQNRQYASGVVFATDTYWEDIDQAYQRFVREFRAAHDQAPSLNAIIGYDAMKFILRAVRTGATHREELLAALSSARPYKGIHSTISLDEGRVNSSLTLLQFKNRSIRKIGEIDVSRKSITGTNPAQ